MSLQFALTNRTFGSVIIIIHLQYMTTTSNQNKDYKKIESEDGHVCL
jgi:hypothetical protein